MKLSELLSLYKAQHSLFGECPSCGEVFRFSDIRAWHGSPPNDWLVELKRMKADFEDKSSSRKKKRKEPMVRLT